MQLPLFWRLTGRLSWPLWLVFVLHGVLGAAVGLSVDEAHYLLYAAHPALSYFDHPPLVGWVQWPLVALQAPVWLLRLLPGLLWLVTVVGVYRLSLQLFAASWPVPGAPSAQLNAQSAAQWAVVALLLAPLLHVLGIGLLPDTLLMALTVALMALTWRLMQRGVAATWTDWLLLGLLVGLAGLAKYTAVFTALAVALCLVYALRGQLRRGPTLAHAGGAVLLAALLVLPVVVWNAQHQWVSFAYQVAHGQGSVWQWQHVLRFALTQLLAYGPLLWLGYVGWYESPSAVRWMGIFFVLPVAVLAYLSGGGSSLPHWTAPSWVALAPFAGWGASQLWARGRRRLLTALLALQAFACAALLGLMLSAGWPVVAGSTAAVAQSPNPFADLHGWDAAGERAKQLAAKQGLGNVAVQNWTLASRLGWYARPLPVHVLEDRFDQFDLWAGDLPEGGDALLVDWSYMAYELPLAPHGFARCTLLDTLALHHWGQSLSSFRFYDCRGWTGAPQPRLTLSPAPTAPH
ncbi:MAG: glycosyltransferase family 39 protein [Rhodoferax sp.]|nr:glycosyltransferase family 39 protein [Rhodoferax sp.]